MSVTTTNLIMGPATLYLADFGATEPTDTAVNDAPAASAWTDLGGTQDGCKLTVDQTYTDLEVDQIVDVAGARLTKRLFTIETNLAEPTLENLRYILNDGTAASGSGFKSFEPIYASSATQPTYRAVLLDGYGPNQLRRRFIIRKCLSNDKVESTYKKDSQTLFTVKWSGFFVTSSIAPFKLVDATS
ncbi:phage tail tube protein [Streptomyces sp. NEAU-174]|uniref:phage tail tube protein n=1 Tax=Streptomyces sp. NEAU-174 TaxID=3458254 RepID=UPI004044BD2F